MTKTHTHKAELARTSNKAQPRVTKKTKLIRMLSTKTGTNLAAVEKALGWQGHTTRAAMSGLRKAGYGIETNKSGAGKPTRYRIISAPSGISQKQQVAEDADAR